MQYPRTSALNHLGDRVFQKYEPKFEEDEQPGDNGCFGNAGEMRSEKRDFCDLKIKINFNTDKMFGT